MLQNVYFWIFKSIQNIPSGKAGIGDNQPPKNKRLVSPHIKKTAINTPPINNRNGVELYSTWKPATNSDSASGRSNGGLFVSARAEIKN